ncbi:group II intron maturase-specific domain-containing protein [Hahella chejuensis]|uniref:group II intron maturase-specific domain-containing protein n=1 Tax=Hahella chejuensis TaxID=158327 RepID=UPI00031286D2|nr:group II intron maturase-specific domain-containing protein [Hahella chejuensis]
MGRSRALPWEICRIGRGWINYFHHADTKGIFNELDGWLRRHLRKILWRQWKRGLTRARMLRRLGIDEKRAALSTTNGRGPSNVTYEPPWYGTVCPVA